MIDADAMVSIEASVRAALPAREEVAAGDWVLRLSGGATKRVNSANPVVAGALVEPVVELAEATYRSRSLPTRFRLTPLAALGTDEALARRGYQRVDDSWTMTAPTAGWTVDPDAHLATAPDERWYAGHAAASGWSADEDRLFRPLLARAERLVVATLIDSGRPLGFGLASIVGWHAWLFNIVIAAEARGRGHGRRLVGSLLGAAGAAGVGEASLQVLAANTPARRLYAALGFTDLYPYHYRVAASGE